MTTISEVTAEVIRDDAWSAREQSIARALLILAAMHHRTLQYDELASDSHLGRYPQRVLWPVYEECRRRGEPDLTAILVHHGEEPQGDDEAEAARVFDYWTSPR